MTANLPFRSKEGSFNHRHEWGDSAMPRTQQQAHLGAGAREEPSGLPGEVVEFCRGGLEGFRGLCHGEGTGR